MKKLCVLAVTMITVFFASCNFTEEVFIEEDGSGKISINFDGSGLMEMAGDELGESTEKDIDSIISFKGFLVEYKDSIGALSETEQARLKKLEPFNLHMVMSEERKEMMFEMYTDFNTIGEVSDIFNTFQQASSLTAGGKDDSQNPFGGSGQTAEVAYTYANNNFSRKATIVDAELHQQSLDSLQGMEMFFSNSSYTLKYHFPKKIKSASVDEATYSADGKTLIYEVGFMEYMKNPESLNLEVELED